MTKAPAWDGTRCRYCYGRVLVDRDRRWCEDCGRVMAPLDKLNPPGPRGRCADCGIGLGDGYEEQGGEVDGELVCGSCRRARRAPVKALGG